MAEAGCEYMIMEVISQGIKMRRTDGLFFDYGLFTNISPDHIGPDEHADFDEYLYYKSRLMSMCKVGLANRGDAHFDGIVKDAACKVYSYRTAEAGGDGPQADFTAGNIRYVAEETFVGTEFDVTAFCPWTCAWESRAYSTWTTPWRR